MLVKLEASSYERIVIASSLFMSNSQSSSKFHRYMDNFLLRSPLHGA